MIGEISSVRMWSSISSLPYSKSNVKHEKNSCLSQACYSRLVTEFKTFKILFYQFKSVFRFINGVAGLFPKHVKEEDFHLEYRNFWIIFVNIYLAHP